MSSYYSSITWVTGSDHTAWLEMTAYYASWYKTGVQPAIAADSASG